jgi:hypothetical protein
MVSHRGGVSNVDIDGNNALQIKAIGVVISTFETLSPKGIDCLLSLTRCFTKFFALPSYVAKEGIRPKRWR